MIDPSVQIYYPECTHASLDSLVDDRDVDDRELEDDVVPASVELEDDEDDEFPELSDVDDPDDGELEDDDVVWPSVDEDTDVDDDVVSASVELEEDEDEDVVPATVELDDDDEDDFIAALSLVSDVDDGDEEDRDVEVAAELSEVLLVLTSEELELDSCGITMLMVPASPTRYRSLRTRISHCSSVS